MKRLEKMGIDLTTEEGLATLLSICPKESQDYLCCPIEPDGKVRACGECVAHFLLSEVPTKKVKRWKTYNGDFEKALIDYRNQDKCKVCNSCKHTVSECFAHWLMEEIEVEE